jgi:hypothetical protein
LARARDFIVAELCATGASVTQDRFIAKTPIGPIPMTNIVAKVPGVSPSIVIMGGHYDTKDGHAVRRCQRRRVQCGLLARNGQSASSQAKQAPILGGLLRREEAVQRWSATDSLYGSRHLAEEVAAHGAQRHIKALVLVDMVADADLDIHRDTNSTPWLQDLVFTQARRLGYGRYFSDGSKTIKDDHIPFVQIGIPAVEIIDLDYGPLNLTGCGSPELRGGEISSA